MKYLLSLILILMLTLQRMQTNVVFVLTSYPQAVLMTQLGNKEYAHGIFLRQCVFL